VRTFLNHLILRTWKSVFAVLSDFARSVGLSRVKQIKYAGLAFMSLNIKFQSKFMQEESVS